YLYFFFFTAPTPPEIYTLSLHDALPIWEGLRRRSGRDGDHPGRDRSGRGLPGGLQGCGEVAHRIRGHRPREGRRGQASARRLRRSEEHTSELQSPCNLVCRLLLEKKKKK